MINHWCTTEGKDLKESFIAEMLNAQTEIRFASKAADIIRDRQPAFSYSDEWDENDVCHIREFNKNIECGIELYCTLKSLYSKAYDDIDMVEQAIKVAADNISDTMLVKFGWDQKGSEVNNGK